MMLLECVICRDEVMLLEDADVVRESGKRRAVRLG